MVRDYLSQNVPIDTIVKEICHRCLADSPKSSQGIGCDNMTILIVELKRDGSIASASHSSTAAESNSNNKASDAGESVDEI